MTLLSLRDEYHRQICHHVIRLKENGEESYPNFADEKSQSSRTIALGVVERLGCSINDKDTTTQTAESLFINITRGFLEQSFGLLTHLRPGEWYFTTQAAISEFDQYKHLETLGKIVARAPELISSVGIVHIIRPDIVVARKPVSDHEINQREEVLIAEDSLAQLSPLREINYDPAYPILHASISCKWTIRSDRVQNSRAEALNLVRNRKGNLPHVVAVTAEPMPTRLAVLALGTGDLDCVYHFALPELRESILAADNEDQLDMLKTLVEGRRLRDISDLPFDLAV